MPQIIICLSPPVLSPPVRAGKVKRPDKNKFLSFNFFFYFSRPYGWERLGGGEFSRITSSSSMLNFALQQSVRIVHHHGFAHFTHNLVA